MNIDVLVNPGVSFGCFRFGQNLKNFDISKVKNFGKHFEYNPTQNSHVYVFEGGISLLFTEGILEEISVSESKIDIFLNGNKFGCENQFICSQKILAFSNSISILLPHVYIQEFCVVIEYSIRSECDSDGKWHIFPSSGADEGMPFLTFLAADKSPVPQGQYKEVTQNNLVFHFEQEN